MRIEIKIKLEDGDALHLHSNDLPEHLAKSMAEGNIAEVTIEAERPRTVMDQVYRWTSRPRR